MPDRTPTIGDARIARPRRRWPPGWLAVALGGGVVLVVLLFALALPYLEEQRAVATAVPQPYPLFSVALVELHRGQSACSNEIDLLPGRQQAQIRVGLYGKPAVPLVMTLSGPGYSRSVSMAPDYIDNALVSFPFSGPSKTLLGSVCVADRGARKIALYASDDRTKSRSTTLVDGRTSAANFDLAFYSSRGWSLLDRMGDVLRRMKLFHANVAVWLLWVLMGLFVLAVTIGSLAAVALAAGWRAETRGPAGG